MYLTLNIIVTLKCGLELGCGLLFAFYSNYNRICSRLLAISASKNSVNLKTGLGFV